jgi:predicted nucleotidyltransferase component of viral defense system
LKDTDYFRQASLVLDILPLVNRDTRFALKGGTAINFFIRPLPRLSVDIDLTYLPIENREITLKNIDKALHELAGQIENNIPEVNVAPKRLKEHNLWCAMQVYTSQARIKIEPNLIARGSVFSVEERTLVHRAQELFERSMKVQSLSFADLYGSKLCAALDRQHPRDLFDVKLLLDNEGITDKIRTAFIVYLISHNRPMNELLNPTFQDISHQFKIEFEGMMFNPIRLDELNHARKELVTQLLSGFTENEKEFLVSIKSKKPRWDLIEVKHIKDLPAVKWKLLNLEKMDKKRHEEALTKLVKIFE